MGSVGSRRVESSFLPVRVLGQVFRAKFLAKLRQAYRGRELRFYGEAARLAKWTAFSGWLRGLREKRWVVYAKRPFGSPARVLKYLAQYTHKVAISNSRLLRMENGLVSFRYRDRKLANVQREMTLGVDEFIRRFLLHTLPKGLQRIRHYGFLANACRGKKLAQCRALLGVVEGGPKASVPSVVGGDVDEVIARDRLCPLCQDDLVRESILPLRLMPRRWRNSS